MDTEAKKFLGKLWAENGDRSDPESKGIDRSKGWDINYEQPGTGKYPERDVFNQMIRELQGAFQEHMLYGFPRWSSDVAWNRYDFVLYSGSLYFATRDNGGEGIPSPTPGMSDDWRLY